VKKWNINVLVAILATLSGSILKMEEDVENVETLKVEKII
jgi:hypothetical protein